MPIYGEKHLHIFFSRNKKASRLNLVIWHQELRVYQVCSNDDLWWGLLLWNSLTNFHQISSLAFCRISSICSNGSTVLTRRLPCPYIVKTLKNLLLKNQESFKRIIKQDGRHAHIWWKTLTYLLLQKQESFKAKSWYMASGTHGLSSLSKWRS